VSPTGWQDFSDPSLTAVLPKLSTGLFDIRTHLGIIILEEDTCTDTGLNLSQKLAVGTIYEHAGPEMERSLDGRGVTSNAELVETFTALEFIGHTIMNNDDLDDLCVSTLVPALHLWLTAII
jgi:hypothetical protein